MRPLQIGLAIFSAVAFLFAACSQDPGSAATSTGGAPNCTNALNQQDDACYLCVHKECCAELSVCDDHCIYCFTTLGGPDTICGHEFRALGECAGTRCYEGCYHTSSAGAGGTSSSAGAGGTSSSSSGG